MSKTTSLAALAAFITFGNFSAWAADQNQTQIQDQTQIQNRDQSQNQVRQSSGRQVMSPQERDEQRSKMQNANSREEQERIRAEHHEEMKGRAQDKGLSIPDTPPSRRQGIMGGGMGGGAGGGRGGR